MIVISPADLAAIEAQAAAAPNEACGLLEGTTGADGFAVTSVHPSDNLAWKPMEMFEVDPLLLLQLRGCRGETGFRSRTADGSVRYQYASAT